MGQVLDGKAPKEPCFADFSEEYIALVETGVAARVRPEQVRVKQGGILGYGVPAHHKHIGYNGVPDPSDPLGLLGHVGPDPGVERNIVYAVGRYTRGYIDGEPVIAFLVGAADSQLARHFNDHRGHGVATVFTAGIL